MTGTRLITVAFWALNLLAAMGVNLVESYPRDQLCGGSGSWVRGAQYGQMEVNLFSTSPTACTLEISPAVTTYSAGQTFSVTVRSTSSWAYKVESTGGAQLTAGPGGTLRAQDCLDYNTKRTSATLTMRAPTTGGPIRLRALCGTENVMAVATEIVLQPGADVSAPTAVSSDASFQAERQFRSNFKVFSNKNATHVDLKIEYAGTGYVSFGVGSRMVPAVVVTGVDVASNPGYSAVGLYRLVGKSGKVDQLIAGPAQLASFGIVSPSFTIASGVSTLRFSVVLAAQKPEFTIVPSAGSAPDVVWASGPRAFVLHDSFGIESAMGYGTGSGNGPVGPANPGQGTKSADPNFAFDSQLDPKLVVSYKKNDTHGSFKVKLTGAGYISMGPGKLMIGANAIVGMDPSVNPGYPAVGLYKLNSKTGNSAQIMSNVAVTPDALASFGIADTSYAVVGTDSELRFSIELAKQQDVFTLFPGATFSDSLDVLYAAGAPEYSLHPIFGSLSLNFANGVGGAGGFQIDSALSSHIVLMILAWEMLAPFGIVAPLLNNAKYGIAPAWGWTGPRWFKAHWVVLTLGVFFGFIGTLTGFLFVDARGSAHWSSTHKNLGLVMLLGSIAQPLWGRFRPSKTKTGELKTRARAAFEAGHPLFGYLLLLLGMVNCLIGVQELERIAGGQSYVMGPLTGDTGFEGAMGVIIVLLFVFSILTVLYGFARVSILGNKSGAAMGGATAGGMAMTVAKVVDVENPAAFTSNNPRAAMTWNEVMNHTNERDCYVVYEGKVLNVTGFLQTHPGGKRAILQLAGKDITSAFKDVGHSANAVAMIAQFTVGHIAGSDNHQASAGKSQTMARPVVPPKPQMSAFPPSVMSSSSSRNSGNKLFVRGASQTRHRVHVKEKIPISHNVFMLKLALPSPNMVLGLPHGKHVCLFAPAPAPSRAGMWNGRSDPEAGKSEISRKYTPVSCDAKDSGYFTLVIKSYRPNASKGFPDGGKMSRFLETLKVGDAVDVAGPFGSHEYLGNGVFTDNGAQMKVRHVAMIAGGSGITPVFQLARAMLMDPNDPCRISIVYANSTLEDVLIKSSLDDLERKYPKRVQVWYTISQPPPPNKEWAYSVGRITKEMLQKRMPPASTETLVIACGPRPMLDHIAELVSNMGYAEERYIEY